MASVLTVPCQPQLLKKHRFHGYCHTKASSNLVIRNEKTSSFSYRSTVNVPLYELPGASFDQYMDNKHRIIQAVFPDKGTTKQLNEEEWRIKMPPIQCLFLNVQPTADVRLTFKSNGEGYPPNIPHHITKILELHFLRWELQGLSSFYMDPYNFNLDVKGTIYPERRGTHSWLKNQTEMKISFCVSPTMAFIPENVLQDTFELVFKTMLDEVKKEFQGRLLADYSRFKRNKLNKKSV
ncbi:uncharacterized protein LOC133310651 [Gastrolobium bilobum]|uniref:uncharacterized protein LOC133310651 n=1 Tax=Gastrolobium bilobum TaxID=150636 RepID=UPI002AB24C5E|nr:uncharacterized protein LOC133310651 [Gastrolobium bilobum]